MYLSVHATAGVLIGSYAANSPVAFLVGVASHFLLDMLPHRDGMEPESNLSIRQVRQRYFDKIVGIIYLDVCLSIVVAGALLTNNIHFVTPAIIWGILGAVLPDLLQVCAFLLPKIGWLRRFQALHNLLHYNPKRQISFVTGHVTQFVTLVSFVYPLV